MKKKALVLSLGLAIGLLSTTNVNAQGIHGNLLDDCYAEQDQSNQNGGVLRRNTRGNRDSGMEWSGGGMTAQDPTEQTPLGSGLMLLVAIGAGYAIVKSKNGKEEQR